ncbi:efflux RND transporter periplasmic adaptor subunit [Xylophilus sp. Leaf220]|uniref:efflux RND transporter periplasmic adaptor subunit n=1 Tax=Xylophilus sp. Leaf220 TaxID=1735686 RepID=UPI0009E9FFFF|nr:efflux RND transporter periplasmic adaptor subunit [Xylophilus sp. Leaf220]
MHPALRTADTLAARLLPATLAQPARRRLALLSIAGGLGLATAAGLFGLNRANAADKPAAPRPALSVTTVLPQKTSLPVSFAANGSIAAWQEAIIGSEANGLRLTDVLVNVGDTVKAGQVLATFSAETVKAELAQSRASVLEAEATAADAAANAQRARTLEKSGALSASQIAQYQTTEQTAKARVEAARAAYNAQQVRLGYASVRAPDSGVISARTATVGSVVGAGTELFRMVRKGRLEWRAEVTSAELGRIQPGTVANIVAASGAALEGKVRMVAPTVDPQTRNGLVYVDLPATSRNGIPAKAGMFARGDFVLGQTDALTVPQQSVVVREAFSYVFAVDQDQRVSQRKVQTGRRVGDRLEITAGLAADTPVVVQGAGFLNDRDLVKVVQESEQKTPAAGDAPRPAATK